MTPIVLFVYNRPEHTRRALASLAQCSRLNECDVTVYCDGPKSPAQAEAVESARHVVREWATTHRADVIERVDNLGLARSVVAGVTEMCERYGRVIVLEDDLVVAPNFLDYMLRALDMYADEERVYQISGYMFPVRHPPTPEAMFLPLTTTWGWATWGRAWRIFAWNPVDAIDALRDTELRYRFDLHGSYPCSRMLEQRLIGANDSWGILWWWSVFCISGLVLHPARTLVMNFGFDGTGTHGEVRALGLSYQDGSNSDREQILVLPEVIAESTEHLMRIEKHLMEMHVNLPPNRFSNLRFRLRQLASR